MKQRATALAAACAAFSPMAALAHATPQASRGGLRDGFLHPLTGLDHMLAMVAVGVLAAMLGGRAIGALPAAFVLAMVAGAGLGVAGAPLPMVEPAIALSVIILGVVVAAGYRLPTALATGLVAILALFHGHAHGTEAGDPAQVVPFGAGFVAATLALHLAGILLGRSICRLGPAPSRQVCRVIGAAGAVAGAGIMVG